MTEGEVEVNGKTTAATETQELDKKIIKQVEYYFGDFNLPRDKHLQELIKNDDGWITLDEMMKFKRLAALSTNTSVIAESLKKSTNNIVEVHESNEKIRRIPSRPLQPYSDEVKEETVKKTVYCKGFPKDGSCTLDDLLEFFNKYGPCESVLMRHFLDRSNPDGPKQGFKGSVYVIFPTEEKAEEFRELDEVRYKDTLLLRKWQSEYLEEKRKEIEERRARKEARKKEREQNDEEEEEVVRPKGMFIHFSGIPEDSCVTREELKTALGEFGELCAFIDYSKGLQEGFFRFKEPEFNGKVLEKTEGKLKVQDIELTLRKVEGEEEEEQLKKMKEALKNAKFRASSNKKRKMGGGGRGGFGNKRRRN
ncbi:hypothetical protein SK128_021424 [Halocaridina rubra]|uniref:Lupus La protein n=1 Tax=Halocaridina rubra TaxID=373956 RepID=A0AAN8XNX2_HALRR